MSVAPSYATTSIISTRSLTVVIIPETSGQTALSTTYERK